MTDRDVSLIYTAKHKGMGNECQRCRKKIQRLAHYFTEKPPESEDWGFESDCVKYIFGAG